MMDDDFEPERMPFGGYPTLTQIIDEVDSSTPPSSPSDDRTTNSMTHATNTTARHHPTESNTTYTHHPNNTNTSKSQRSSSHGKRHHQQQQQQQQPYPRGYSRLLSLIEKDGESQGSNARAHSRINAAPATTTTGGRRHSTSRPRSQSTSKSHSDSVSALLLLTTERLSHETARANAAERRAGELVAHVRTANEGRERVQAELGKVQAELELWKIQLDAAQKEIFRAQRVVDDLERARADAEEQAKRDRERTRKLIEERLVTQAMEEGRRMGYSEGLKRGQKEAWAAGALVQEGGRGRGSIASSGNGYEDETYEDDTVGVEDMVDVGSLGTSVRAASSPRTRTSTSSSSSRRSRRDYVPDVAHYSQGLPIPTITTPVPVRIPSSQAQQPLPTRPPSSGYGRQNGANSGINNSNASHQPRRSSSASQQPRQHQTQSQQQQQPRLIPAPTRSPEDIDIHPVPVHNRSPSVSHRSIVLPPDGYIPTLGADLRISLPPPHELSHPVPSPGTSVTDLPEAEGGKESRNGDRDRADRSRDRDRDRGSRRDSHRDAPRVRDYAYPDGSARPRTREQDEYSDVQIFGRTTTMSTGSTRISQYDIVSPPRESRARSGDREGAGANASRSASAAGERRTRTQPEQIVQEWRSANSDILSGSGSGRSQQQYTPTPASTRRTQRSGLMYSNPNASDRSNDRSTTRFTSSRAASGSGPRRPREVVMPVPLSSTLLGPSPGTTNVVHRTRQTQDSTQPSTARSSSTVQIAVESPSETSPNVSETTVIDPVLLTPTDMPIPIPHANRIFQSRSPSNNNNNNDHVTVVLPDHIPLGFVPMSPIPSLSNIYPKPSVSHGGPPLSSPRPTYLAAPIPEGVRYPEPPRPPTAAGMSNGGDSTNSTARSSDRQRAASFGGVQSGHNNSPAPLNRPLSIFSDSDND